MTNDVNLLTKSEESTHYRQCIYWIEFFDHYSTHPLDIQDYIKITDFEINSLMFSWFWQIMIDDNRWGHVSPPVLNFFGYEGDDREQRRKSFKKLIDRNNVPYKEIAHNDPEAKNYPTIEEEAVLLPNKGALAKQRFIIMAPRDIKEAIMMLNTKTAKIVRNYYLDLENLIKEYACYTNCFKNRQYEFDISSITFVTLE